MNSSPTVSIVTAVYNQRRWLPRRVDSIRKQTFEDFEWIIVDDASTDGSHDLLLELTRDDPRIQVLRNENNLHIGPTNQRGIDLARGRYLYRTDGDDYCFPAFLTRMVDLLETNPQAVLAHCRGLMLDEHDRYWGGIPRWKAGCDSGIAVAQRQLQTYTMRSSTILYSLDAVRQVGGFNQMNLMCQHDWYLTLRVCLLGDVVRTPDPLAAQRRHSNNASSNISQRWRHDPRQLEIEFFSIIDDILSRLSSNISGNALTHLQALAYNRAAEVIYAIAEDAATRKQHDLSLALSEMARRRGLAHPRKHPLRTAQSVYRNGLRMAIKLLTRKTLPVILT